ncbi:MAG TPA: LacI family DNA-binding transcriptional regulator [Flavisolibacter sp.]|nr:LacI family DNA-binding transcriptional regulator [Flavisolibacter sp.]
MKKGVTIKDIANKLNMSFSTVSKALNNDKSISAFTKQRVHRLAAEWQYVPNESARHFKLNKSFTIGLIIPTLLDQFYVLAINGVESEAEKEKYNVILSQTGEEVANEERISNVMIRNRVDGVIVAITKNTANMLHFEKLVSIGIPVVCIAREPASPSFYYVSSDNFEGAYKATAFLIKKGHRRIAHLMGPASMGTAQVRLAGYKQALEKNRLAIDPHLIKVVDFTEQSTVGAMKELMKLQNPPSGIFSFKNYINLDAIAFLKKKYLDRLGSIDFVGFGNLPLLQYLDHKPIASIEESSYEMGEAAADLLFRMIKAESIDLADVKQQIQIPCKLVVHK